MPNGRCRRRCSAFAPTYQVDSAARRRLAADFSRSPTKRRRHARACSAPASRVSCSATRVRSARAVRIGDDYYQVVGVLRDHGAETGSGGTLAWHDVNQVAFVPFSSLSRRSTSASLEQPADEIWVQVTDGERADELGAILQRVLNRSHSADRFHDRRSRASCWRSATARSAPSASSSAASPRWRCWSAASAS